MLIYHHSISRDSHTRFRYVPTMILTELKNAKRGGNFTSNFFYFEDTKKCANKLQKLSAVINEGLGRQGA